MPTLDSSLLTPVRLTELTDCGGCAAKLGADLLADALRDLAGGTPEPAELIAGLERADDAAAYRISDDVAVIGTLDFFPPLVDDARTFGEIAAANALSDVFAMGGRVLFALSIAAFPEDLPRDTMAAIFEGAAGRVREAGGTLAGGHTIRDPEPKYGLAVIGVAHPDRLLRKGGARPGDALILTKRLGTGLLVSGRREGRTSAADLEAAIDQMRQAQPGRLGGPGGSADRGGDRRHGLRPPGPRPRDGPCVGDPPRCSMPGRCRAWPGRSSWPGWASRREARRTIAGSSRRPCRSRRASPTRSSRSRMIPRPRVACWRPSRRPT